MHDSTILFCLPPTVRPVVAKTTFSILDSLQLWRMRFAPMLFSGQLGLAKTTSPSHFTKSFPRILKNEKGFAAVVFLSLLPVALALIFSLAIGANLISSRRTVLNGCRQDLLQGLDKAAKPMNELLALNPTAQALQLRWIQLKISLAAATAAGNPMAVASLTKQMVLTYKNRQKLHRLQKILFQTANVALKAAQQKANQNLSHKEPMIDFRPLVFARVRPAIRPKSGDVAPVWELYPRFSQVQTLKHRFKWNVEISGVSSRFLEARHSEVEICAATLIQSKNGIEAQLR